MNRVSFYTYGERYMGWKYLNNGTINEIVSWIRSGNTVKYAKETVTTVERIKAIYRSC